MDNQIVSMLLHAFNLARELESNLPNWENKPDLISDSCSVIVSLFSAVREQIMNNAAFHDHYQHRVQMTDVVNFAKPGVPLQLDHQQQPLQQQHNLWVATDGGNEEQLPESGSLSVTGQFGAWEGCDPARCRASSSSPRRPRRRQDDPTRRTVIVEAPQFGNTEIPPEDGFTWKKYGRKEILGALYPRSYYRCTHQNLYGCAAKKQVQLQDSIPNTFQVTYRGIHTCLMSPATTLGNVVSQPPSTHLPGMSSHWLFTGFNLGGSARFMAHGHHLAPREDPYQLVADMADGILNSGSSSSNSMDMIFSSMEHKDID